MDLVKVLSEQQLKSDLPVLKIGDTVKVHAKIKEGNRERIQVFEGIIIAKKHAVRLTRRLPFAASLTA